MKTLTRSTVDSPVGLLRLIGSDSGLRAILWPEEREGRVTFDETIIDGEHPVLTETATQLASYLAGDRHDFDLPLDPVGTDFQREVWAGLQEIPYGETQTYGELADSLEKPGAARAVGAATGRNPISIVIPCHRLVGSTGALTGFAGGIESKRWLLNHESNSLF
ncbi:MAG: methylated-DNA--[protein]-cysteine S-methyltransferase [Acidimicrobiia bacterium]|nr:methylated-DNA--[protein]-cysteine S-methyltransferase [Acidimicrobiia bacterium]